MRQAVSVSRSDTYHLSLLYYRRRGNLLTPKSAGARRQPATPLSGSLTRPSDNEECAETLSVREPRQMRRATRRGDRRKRAQGNGPALWWQWGQHSRKSINQLRWPRGVPRCSQPIFLVFNRAKRTEILQMPIAVHPRVIYKPPRFEAQNGCL